jgi:hypothetical protein
MTYFDICRPICGASFMRMLKRIFQVHTLIDFSTSNKKEVIIFKPLFPKMMRSETVRGLE